MHQRKAASVLPLPVGADIRVCWPAATDRQPPSWTSVGAAKAPENQARAAGENRSKTAGMEISLCPTICLFNPVAIDFPRNWDASNPQGRHPRNALSHSRRLGPAASLMLM